MKRIKPKLRKLAENSKLMEIEIIYGDEFIHFNLYQELAVNESRLNEEIKEQPSHFAFISMIAAMLSTEVARKQGQVDKRYARIFAKEKQTIDDTTERATSKELADALVINNRSYQKLLKQLIELKNQSKIAEICVKAFDQRSFLIQTLSANLRKEH